jgi:PAS domain S-box-containing protein
VNKPTCEDLERKIGLLEDESIKGKQAAAALQTSEEKYRLLVENAAEAIFVAQDGMFRFMNGKTAEMLGYERDELYGRPFIDFIHPDDRSVVFELHIKRQQGIELPSNYNFRIIDKSGKTRWADLNVVRIEWEGKIATLNFATDITHLKLAGDALSESEQKYRLMFDNTPLGLLHFDQQGVITACNNSFVGIVGSSRAALIGLNMLKLPNVAVTAAVKEAIDGRPGYYEGEYESTTAKKKTQVKCIFMPLRMENGKLLGGTGIIEDITERKYAEEALRESECRFREVIESAVDGILLGSPEGVITGANASALNIFGAEKDALLGKHIKEIFSPRVLEAKPLRFDLLNEGKTIVTDRTIVRPDGTNVTIEMHSKKMPDGSYQSIIRDVSKRKQAENALQESQEKFRVLADSTPTAVMLYQDDRWIYVNKAAVTICGYSEEELLTMNFWDLVHPRFKGSIQREGRKRQQGEETTNRHEFKIITKDAAEKWVDLAGASTTLGGRPAGILSIIDITERKQAEEALRKSEVRQGKMFANIGDVIVIIDQERIVQYKSPNIEKWFGWKPEEVVGASIWDNIHPEDITSAKEFIDSLLKEPNAAGTTECRYLCKDGSYKCIEFTGVNLLNDPDIRGLLGNYHDITDRKRAEEQRRILERRLQRAEKMEALGQLAGGVAHDLNNVLGILSGYSELVLMEIPPGHRSRTHVEKILQSTGKGAAIIQDLLTLARRGVKVEEVVNLNTIVSAFVKTLVFEKMKEHHYQVSVMTKCDNSLLNIKGAPVHLEKALMNLISNAMEAISGRGEVTILTENRYLDSPVKGYDEIKEGDYAVLTVSDTGKGIPAESTEKIFEPFYTKKNMGRSGTGLGLAIVWGTVKDHNGYIDVQTKVGEGSTFTLYFPVTREALTVPQQKQPIDQYMGRGESVLVVDDIAEQREIASELLKRLGYKVHAVSGGEEAVEYLRNNKADIVILDMIMTPGIDGLETYRRILEINPGQKAILVSGFSQTERVSEAQKLGAGAYIKKPYIMETIGTAIRNELMQKNERIHP